LSPAQTELDQRLLRWFGARLGLPPPRAAASGGSAVNHDALAVTRDRHAGWDARRQGMRRARA